MNRAILNYEKACEKLALEIVKRYYEKDCEKWWVADDIGGVLFINDQFLSLNLVVEALRHDLTKDEYFDYYDYQLDQHMEGKSPYKLSVWLGTINRSKGK